MSPGAALFILLCTAATASAAEAEKEFRLTVEGSPAAMYTGRCHVVAVGGQETILPISGAPPFRQLVIGRHLDCRIRQDSGAGFLVVEVRVGTNVSRSRTQGAGSVITISLQ